MLGGRKEGSGRAVTEKSELLAIFSGHVLAAFLFPFSKQVLLKSWKLRGVRTISVLSEFRVGPFNYFQYNLKSSRSSFHVHQRLWQMA